MQLPRPLAASINCLPLPLVQRAVALVFRQVLARHPGLFDRLGPYANRRFRFDPTDLGFSFVVYPAGPDITVYRAGKAPPASATVSGPLVTLLALLEGQIDGDAVFFSRSLSVSGDMEAMLALRNGLDDCGFDLPRDLSGLAGPFAPPLQRLAEAIRARALAGMV
ncbi:MAG: SCP2 sterol-binding domain-containing protein [Devosia sp.]|nr:SCP2 sterol-binding domain-containing protein [Devosia sp.]